MIRLAHAHSTNIACKIKLVEILWRSSPFFNFFDILVCCTCILKAFIVYFRFEIIRFVNWVESFFVFFSRCLLFLASPLAISMVVVQSSIKNVNRKKPIRKKYTNTRRWNKSAIDDLIILCNQQTKYS